MIWQPRLNGSEILLSWTLCACRNDLPQPVRAHLPHRAQHTSPPSYVPTTPTMAWSVSTYGGVGTSGDATQYAGICDVLLADNETSICAGTTPEQQALAAAATGIGDLEAAIGAANSSMDWMWLLLGGALVFFMHSGFALLEVGSVSVRNTQVRRLSSPRCAAAR